MPDIGKYEDILYLPHHVSPTRRRMTMAERAAQFSPFAALVGYEGAVWETGRITERKNELSEDEKAVLDHKQQIILAALERGERPSITVTYFQPDEKKDGGKYVTITGSVKKAVDIDRKITLSDGVEINFSEIANIEINLCLDSAKRPPD